MSKLLSKMKYSIAAASLLTIAPAFAATALYGQCGGENFTGDTTCASGSTCVVQNPYYSQCVESSSDCDASSAEPVTPQTTTAATHAPTTTSAVVSKASTSSAAAVVSKASTSTSAVAQAATTSSASTGLSYKASFTWYGSGDTFGSPNCQTNTAACSFYTSPGYAAAVSQNEFGVGPGAGAGPACGTCWKLTGSTDSSGNALSGTNSIVVMVNNLCPADGNPLCSQSGLTGTNQYGANLNFDLCSDSGAKAAFFGSSGAGLAVGSASQVDCSEWSGTIVH